MPEPQAGKPDMGLKTLTPVGDALRYSYFSVFGSSTCVYQICLSGKSAPPTVFLWPLLCLCVCNILLGKFHPLLLMVAQQLVAILVFS